MEPEAGMGTRLKHRSKGTSKITDKGRTGDDSQGAYPGGQLCRGRPMSAGCRARGKAANSGVTIQENANKDWVTRSELKQYLWFHGQMVQVMSPGKAGQGHGALQLWLMCVVSWRLGTQAAKASFTFSEDE